MSTWIKVIITLAVVIGVGVGGFLLVSNAEDSFKGDYVRCEVTVGGVTERRANGIDDPAQGEADAVVVGKVYQSQSGCIPGDTPVD